MCQNRRSTRFAAQLRRLLPKGGSRDLSSSNLCQLILWRSFHGMIYAEARSTTFAAGLNLAQQMHILSQLTWGDADEAADR